MTAVVAGLILLALLANTFSRRKSKLTYILIVIFGVAALAFIWFSKITLPEQATQKQQQNYLERLPAQGEFRVTISIDQRIEDFGIKVGRFAIDKTMAGKVGKGVVDMLDKAVFDQFRSTGFMVLCASLGTIAVGVVVKVIRNAVTK